MRKEVAIVRDAMSMTQKLFLRLIDAIPSFKVLDEALVPEGLKPHTRSVCWLMEQVILQNTKNHGSDWGLIDLEYPTTDISVWDAKFGFADMPGIAKIFVNVKVSDATKPQRRNDIASVKALIDFYRNEPDAVLLCVVFKFKFSNVWLSFDGKPLVIHYPWIDEFVVNPRNEHIQAVYECGEKIRTNQEFVNEVREKARAKGVID